MVLSESERVFVEGARVGRLATADADGRPHVVPICYALDGDRIVSALDEKPKEAAPTDLRRVRDIAENPRVAIVVDRYAEEWDALGWVQIRGVAAVIDPGADGHARAVGVLREKYDQYADHALHERPVIGIEPGTVLSWGDLSRE